MTSRKGIRSFVSQVEALKYYTLTIINAANRGWFETDEVVALFRREVEKWDGKTDHCVGEFWGLVCLPVLKFFSGIVVGGDDSMACDFTTGITRWKKTQFVEGTLTWCSQGTHDRFIHLVFQLEGGARMYYNLGDGYDHNRGEYVPRQSSGFLHLPAEGDTDLSAMTHKEFAKLAKEAVNA